jgi:hypothetical protein
MAATALEALGDQEHRARDDVLEFQQAYPAVFAQVDDAYATIAEAEVPTVVALRALVPTFQVAKQALRTAEQQQEQQKLLQLRSTAHPLAAGPGGTWGDRRDLAAHAEAFDGEWRELQVSRYRVKVIANVLATATDTTKELDSSVATLGQVGPWATELAAREDVIALAFVRLHLLVRAGSWRVLDFFSAPADPEQRAAAVEAAWKSFKEELRDRESREAKRQRSAAWGTQIQPPPPPTPPAPSLVAGSDGKSAACYVCGKDGHWGRACPSKQR